MFIEPSMVARSRVGRSLLVLLGVALATNTALSAQSATKAQEDKKSASTPAPTLLGISKEIAKLRRSANYLVLLRVKIEGRFKHSRGVHLGDGLIATPYIPGIAAGRAASLSFASSNYRVLSIGSNKDFVSYWKLRDTAYHAALPKPRYFSDNRDNDQGPMVLIVTGKRAKLSLLDTERYNLGLSRPGGSNPAVRWGNVFAYYLEDRFSDVGSAVLSVDGSFVGLLLRPKRNINSTHEKTVRLARNSEADKQRQLERQRRNDSFAMVHDGKLLQNRAAAMLKSLVLAAPPPPSIGVRFPFVDSSRNKAGLRNAYAATNILIVVSKGGPADRAGAKPGDVWRTVNGRPLSAPSQLRLALKGLKASQGLQVRFDRGDKKGLTLVIKPD